MRVNKNKKTGFVIFSILLLACVVFIVLFLKSYSLSSILKRSKESIWHDKSGRYSVTESTITTIDTCNVLSLITRNQSFRRLNCISKIGDDEHFIIAETTNANGGLQFWILDKDKDKVGLPANQIIVGPFSLTEFAYQKKQLKIDSLNFQKEFK